MADLAKLVVKLEAQTAQYMAALDKAEKRISRLQKAVNVANIAKATATAVVAAATSFAFMAKAAVDNADQLYKMSQSTGIAVESLSQLQHAAALSDVSLEELGKASAKMSKAAVDAARGSDKQARAFEDLDVAVQNADGTMRGTEEILLDVADRFSKMENGAAKAALAQDIFGKASARLIPFLNQGRAGIEAMKKEADALGLTITTKAGAAAEQFNDNLTRLKGAGKGIVNQVVQDLLPGFTNLSNKWVEAAKSGGTLSAGVGLLTGLFKGLVSAGIIVTSIFQQLGRLVYGVGAALVRVSQGEFKLAAGELKDAFNDAKSNVTNDIESIAAVWSDSVPVIETAAKDMDEAMGDSIVFNNEKAEDKAKKAAESAMQALKDMAADLTQQVKTFGQGENAVLRYRLAHGDLAETLRTAGPNAQQYADEILRMNDELETLTIKAELAQRKNDEFNASLAEAKSVFEDVQTPAEKYAAKIERLNKLLTDGLLTHETYSRAVAKAQDEFDEASKTENDKFFERFLKNAQDTLGDGISNIISDGFKKGGEAALDEFMAMLSKMATQAIAADIMRWVFGSDGKGGVSTSGGGAFGTAMSFLGGLFGGSRDAGGRGQPGMAYAIGRGAQPELFVPDSPGTFMPANQWMGGRGKLEQNIYFQGRPDQRSLRQLQLETTRQQRAANARLG